MKTQDFINKVYHEDARKLVAALPTASVDSIITDPMYMVAKNKGKNCTYDWGVEPGAGDPGEWWEYHRPIYEQCLRVLKPGGTIALAMGCKFKPHFSDWFGDYRIWGFSRFFIRGVNAFGHIWVVQTSAQKPIRFPDDNALLIIGPRGWWRDVHPCPKSVEEMLFMVRHLTQPGQIVLDPFCGTGSTLVAAALLKREYIGCDVSERYCRVTKRRLTDAQAAVRPDPEGDGDGHEFPAGGEGTSQTTTQADTGAPVEGQAQAI